MTRRLFLSTLAAVLPMAACKPDDRPDKPVVHPGPPVSHPVTVTGNELEPFRFYVGNHAVVLTGQYRGSFTVSSVTR
jgi:hypothetical protein